MAQLLDTLREKTPSRKEMNHRRVFSVDDTDPQCVTIRLVSVKEGAIKIVEVGTIEKNQVNAGARLLEMEQLPADLQVPVMAWNEAVRATAWWHDPETTNAARQQYERHYFTTVQNALAEILTSIRDRREP